jgi:DNA invertase Pin-like site-specific DNA recombinase
MKTTAAIYTRISTDKTGEAVGVANQLAACKKFIQSQGWTVGKIYSDNSISASTGALRPDFEQLLADAPAVVVAYKQDRLSRDPLDTLRIKAAGITGYLTDGGKLDFSSADAGMMTMIRSIVDAAEGQKKAERQKLRTLSDVEKGIIKYSRRPFGSNLDGTLHPQESPAIRLAAARLVSGETTFYKVALDWTEQGLLTPKSKSYGGKPWASGTVVNFFKSPRLIGARVYEGKSYQLAGWEPVLDEETWTQIQILIMSKQTGERGKRSDPGTHLLTGIARCGECGGGMNIAYRGKEHGKTSRAYKCPTPRHVSRVAKHLEELVINDFLYLLPLQGTEKVLHSSESSTAALRTSRINLEMKHQAWITEAVTESISPSVIKAKENKHLQQIAEIDAQIMESSKDEIFSGLVWDPKGTSIYELAQELKEIDVEIRKRWDVLEMHRKRAIIKALYEEVRVLRGGQGKRFEKDKIVLKHTALWEQLRSSK